MLLGVDHLHQNDIIHRDIKLENYLVNIDEQTNKITLKLTDFGLSCFYDMDDPPTAFVGTLNYMAPEILKERPYCHKVDCFALGIILYFLFTMELPFKDRD